MFTGIITHIGVLSDIAPLDKGKKFTISSDMPVEELPVGASVACNGVCLTVTDKGTGEKNWFSVDVSTETLSCTTLSNRKEGSFLNLERALKMGDELGGHVVSGHVDTVAEVITAKWQGEARQVTLRVPAAVMHLIAPKGSVTLDGVSLTVNGVEDNSFQVMLIPHTLQNTTLEHVKEGDGMNLEVDMLARYVARILEKKALCQ